MRASTALKRLERATTNREAREVIRLWRSSGGSNESLVEATIALAARAPDRARLVTKWWRVLLRDGDDEAQAFRLKSLLHRLNGRWQLAAESALEGARRASGRRGANSLRVGAVDALARAGRVKDAIRLGKTLIRQLEESGDFVQAARVRLNVGNALLWQDRYAEAEQMYREAGPILESERRQMEAAAAGLGLSACALFGGRPADALAAATDAQERFRSLGAHFHETLAEVNALQARSLLGEPDRAVRRLRELLPRLEALSPSDAARTEEFLGDAFLRLNLYTEARECFESALRRPEMLRMPLNRANCIYGIAQACLLLGDWSAAKSRFSRAYREYRTLGNKPWAAAAATGLAEVCLERERRDEARQWARTALRELRGRRSPRIEARASLVAARCTGSKQALRRADVLVRRYGLLDERWRIEAEYARATPRQALLRYRKMFDAILQARLLVSSHLAKAAFMRDKEEPLRNYLALLLRSDDPERIREALNIVVRSRSLTLIDEILSARGEALGQREQRRLDELRRRLAASANDSAGTRASSIGTPASLIREWAEMVSALDVGTVGRCRRAPARGAVLVETSDGAFTLRDGVAIRLGDASTDWARELEWLSFELLAPTVDDGASVDACMESLERMASLVSPALGAESVSPSGAFWRVPWQALSLIHSHQEPVVLYSPVFNADAGDERLPSRPRVAVWAGRADDLPFAEREIEALRAIYPRAIVFRTLAEVQQCLASGEFDLLHVVGHATASAENPMFSRLEFPEGPLFAVEIAGSGLRVDAVVLAACDTGRAPLWSQSEPDGLARAFLARGARWAIASQWSLDDRASLLFVSELHRTLKRGAPVAEALRAARKKARTKHEHPYYWAPMYLLGGYRA